MDQDLGAADLDDLVHRAVGAVEPHRTAGADRDTCASGRDAARERPGDTGPRAGAAEKDEGALAVLDGDAVGVAQRHRDTRQADDRGGDRLLLEEPGSRAAVGHEVGVGVGVDVDDGDAGAGRAGDLPRRREAGAQRGGAAGVAEQPGVTCRARHQVEAAVAVEVPQGQVGGGQRAAGHGCGGREALPAGRRGGGPVVEALVVVDDRCVRAVGSHDVEQVVAVEVAGDREPTARGRRQGVRRQRPRRGPGGTVPVQQVAGGRGDEHVERGVVVEVAEDDVVGRGRGDRGGRRGEARPGAGGGRGGVVLGATGPGDDQVGVPVPGEVAQRDRGGVGARQAGDGGGETLPGGRRGGGAVVQSLVAQHGGGAGGAAADQDDVEPAVVVHVGQGDRRGRLGE